MSCKPIDNNGYELAATPSRKRKRDSGKFDTPVERRLSCVKEAPITACFTNAAFSSTPKKAISKRFLPKNNENPFWANPCLEVKSIKDIVQQKQLRKDVKYVEPKSEHNVPENPYEVVRKPPKKKKKHIEFEEACFENPALNLELPEKQFNPFEVRRPITSLAISETKKGFVNEALNLRGQDVPAARNPFEIQRCSAVSLCAANPAGVENLGLEPIQPSNLKIQLPFTPTIGCRIDFKNMSLSQLTPSKMLAEKLVFSPVPSLTKTPKRSLGSINEETMDIGKELDRYQLELENSINEAKLRKNACTFSTVAEEIVLNVEQKITLTKKLTEIEEVEDEEIEDIEISKPLNKSSNCEQNQNVEKGTVAKNTTKEEIPELFKASQIEADESPIQLDGNSLCNKDVLYSSDEDNSLKDEDGLDFKAPTPFVRSYRRPNPPAPNICKEPLYSSKSNKCNENEPFIDSNNVKRIMRNSIRKLIHPLASQNQKESSDKKDVPEIQSEKLASTPITILSSIRHSLRRKPLKEQQLIDEKNLHNAASVPNISIIDISERTLKLKSNVLQTEYAKIEDLTNEKKYSLRSSIRKSTREVRTQLLKTVFHKKQDEYAFNK